MRRLLGAVLVTAIAVLAPATTARAEPPEPSSPVEVQLLWPVCTIVFGVGICVPP